MTSCGQPSQDWPLGRSRDGCRTAQWLGVGTGQGLEYIIQINPIFDNGNSTFHTTKTALIFLG
jgi:hypothetical protein